MTSLDAFAKSKLAQFEQLTLRRGLTTTTRAGRSYFAADGNSFRFPATIISAFRSIRR